MKILFVTNDPYPPKMAHGMRTFQFWRSLYKTGNEIEILNIDSRNNTLLDKLRINGYNIPYITLKNSFRLFNSKYDLIANMDPVILNLPAPVLSWMKKIPMISDLQDPLNEWRVMNNLTTRHLFGNIFKQSQFITTTHNLLKHELMDSFSIDSDKIGVVHNGVDLSLFKPMIVEKKIDVVYTGSAFSFENLLSKIRIECSNNNKSFLWTPRDVEYPYEKIPLILNQSRVCCFPAEKGHWHNKLLEYLACGCVVVTLKTEQTLKLISNRKNGILVDTETEFIDSLFEVLENDDLRKIISNNAVKSVQQYSWDLLGKKFESYCRSIIPTGSY
jgi:glycosyltransferase involved in cell wall biosynthesis